MLQKNLRRAARELEGRKNLVVIERAGAHRLSHPVSQRTLAVQKVSRDYEQVFEVDCGLR